MSRVPVISATNNDNKQRVSALTASAPTTLSRTKHYNSVLHQIMLYGLCAQQLEKIIVWRQSHNNNEWKDEPNRRRKK